VTGPAVEASEATGGPAAEAVLELRGVTAGHGGPPVVRDLDLSVGAGEVVALLGPNGAGKSTTLCAAAGLLRPTSGDVLLDGRSCLGRPPHRLARDGLSLVPDDRGLFPSLTVAQHLELGSPRHRRAAAVERVLAWFPQLAPLLGRRVGLCSGGEQQMLALGRALAGSPRVLLVDEMSLGLAPIVVQSILPVVRRVAAESGCGVVLVEQHATLALAAADRAAVLSHGRLVMCGPADEVRRDWSRLRESYLG
jgi:branched-chain amino acid transport system ATP-binding protein